MDVAKRVKHNEGIKRRIKVLPKVLSVDDAMRLFSNQHPSMTAHLVHDNQHRMLPSAKDRPRSPRPVWVAQHVDRDAINTNNHEAPMINSTKKAS